MTVTYQGVDCLADQDTGLYNSLVELSQSGKNSQGYQAYFGLYTLAFGLVLVFIMFLKNMLYKYNDYAYRHKKNSRFRSTFLNNLIALSRRAAYTRIPLMVSRITGLPSSIGTLILITSSAVFVFCCLFIPHPWERPCKGFGPAQLASRAGLMGIGLTPFLYLLSGKTNFISYVTGVSYEKLNIFHQGLGWASLFLGLVHTIPNLTQPVAEGGWANLQNVIQTDMLYISGLAVLGALVLICLLSTRISKRISYEMFFHSHWILGITYFALITWHVFRQLNSDLYMWITLGFWKFQMLYRVVVKTSFKASSLKFKSKTAHLRILGNTGSFEVIVPIEGGESELGWQPGQHIFIRFVHGKATLDNHPFSIVTVPKRGNFQSQTKIKLIVNPHGGLTKKLYNLLRQEDGTKDFQTFVDGPYGGIARDVLSFDQVDLLATGSGISATWSFVEHVVANLYNPCNRVHSLRLFWVVKFVDYIDNISDELVDALNSILEARGSLDGFKFEIFVTNSRDVTPKVLKTTAQPDTSSSITLSQPTMVPMSPEALSENSDNKPPDETTSSSLSSSQSTTVPNSPTTPDFNFEKAQPPAINLVTQKNYLDFLTIHMSCKPQIDTYLQSTKLSKGKNCFIVSGSTSFQNDVGNAVARMQRQVLATPDIDEVYLHSESFGW